VDYTRQLTSILEILSQYLRPLPSRPKGRKLESNVAAMTAEKRILTGFNGLIIDSKQ
jgi:hypothetical protein